MTVKKKKEVSSCFYYSNECGEDVCPWTFPQQYIMQGISFVFFWCSTAFQYNAAADSLHNLVALTIFTIKK